MDSGVEQQPRRRSGGGEPRPERLEGSPRGRTAGGFGPPVFKCSRCGVAQRAMGEIGAEAICSCGADLHTCTNCKNFDTSIRWECRETIPERVSPKDVRNECGLFAPKIIRDLAADKGRASATPDDARKAFDDLFRK